MNARTGFCEAVPLKLQSYLTEADMKSCKAIAENRNPIVAEIVSAVSLHSGVSEVAIYGPARHGKVAHARQLVMYVAHRQGLSLPVIGKALSRDHTTVLHGVRAEKKRRGEA